MISCRGASRTLNTDAADGTGLRYWLTKIGIPDLSFEHWVLRPAVDETQRSENYIHSILPPVYHCGREESGRMPVGEVLLRLH